MKVEIWSDIACPYCFLGKKRFDIALQQLPFKDDVEVVWRSFELDPNAKEAYKESKYELLAEKYDQSEEWAKLLCESLTEQGKEIGIEFNFDTNKVTNTFDAHRLLQLAKEHGLADSLKEKLLTEFFSHGALLADHQTLTDIAIASGLTEQQVSQVLSSQQFGEAVREDESIAAEIGIQSVPFFIIDEAYGMEGAQPVEHIQKMLSDIHSGSLS